ALYRSAGAGEAGWSAAAGGPRSRRRPGNIPPSEPETSPKSNPLRPVRRRCPVNSLVQPDIRDQPDKTLWQRPEMRAAAAIRDFTTIYRLLQKQGYPQQRIAAWTGQSQPEVSA